ncbi:hypothetical protein PIB30_056815 [Stylosanthes scabra]|uniref:Uncharacterized protein n=1 Tax=Stylosanthes scabra TaxID=79078 RepID=A0ABU6UIY6_9FABA|nr:hypothetical protein [Stylosanthes scabra]
MVYEGSSKMGVVSSIYRLKFDLWFVCIGPSDGKVKEFNKLELKPYHTNRPRWACGNGRIFLETFSPLYKQAYMIFLLPLLSPFAGIEDPRENSIYVFCGTAQEGDLKDDGTIEKLCNNLKKQSSLLIFHASSSQ